MAQRIFFALSFVFLMGCQTAELSEQVALDPMTYAPRRPASIPEDLNVHIKFSQGFAFVGRHSFLHFKGEGSCTVSQGGPSAEAREILPTETYGLGFKEDSFYLSSKDNVLAEISCEDTEHRRLIYMRDFNLRDLLRAMGAVLTK